MSTAGRSGDAYTKAGRIRASGTPGPSLPFGHEPSLDPLDLSGEMLRDAARGVARNAMLRGHGCTGKGCRRRAHEADREVMREWLKELGLIADPAGERPADPGYRTGTSPGGWS